MLVFLVHKQRRVFFLLIDKEADLIRQVRSSEWAENGVTCSFAEIILQIPVLNNFNTLDDVLSQPLNVPDFTVREHFYTYSLKIRNNVREFDQILDKSNWYSHNTTFLFSAN